MAAKGTGSSSTALDDVCAVFSECVLQWTTMVGMNIYVDQLEVLMRRLDVQVVAPTHGLPVTDLWRTFPKIRHGLGSSEGAFDP